MRIVLKSAFVLVLGALGLGYYIVDLVLNPNLWNAFVFVAFLSLVGFIIYTRRRVPRSKR